MAENDHGNTDGVSSHVQIAVVCRPPLCQYYCEISDLAIIGRSSESMPNVAPKGWRILFRESAPYHFGAHIHLSEPHPAQ